MKLAFLNKYQNKVNRGAETYVLELSKRLSKDYQVDVISDINYLEILRKNYDVIIPTNGRVQALIIRIICFLTSTKMIVSGQSGLGADDKWNLFCFPDVFVALTSAQNDWAKKINPFVKSVTIHNGVDLNKHRPTTKPISIDLKHPIVLNVGAFIPNKRQDLIIKAVSKLENVSLLLVGKGEKEKELQEMGDKLLPGRFKIMSFANDKMPGVYKTCDLFTFPTVPWESFGIVMVEAMASGLAVVANDDPIRREIVGTAGYFVDPTNTEEYAKILEKALKTKWEDKSREQAEKFSWDDIAREYKKLFIEILSAKASRMT